MTGKHHMLAVAAIYEKQHLACCFYSSESALRIVSTR